MTRAPKNMSFEHAASERGFVRICGVDEVGRGPLAGPVTAGAVCLDQERIPKGLRDSKKLTSAKREKLAKFIWATADVSVAHASVAEIDDINILQASLLAMRRAVAGLRVAPDYALIDGKFIPSELGIAADAIVKGDSYSASISAASIVAKVCRDKIMVDLAQQHPGFGWETNAGYGTALHLDALQNLGPTPHHRRSFAPVHKILYQEKTITL